MQGILTSTNLVISEQNTLLFLDPEVSERCKEWRNGLRLMNVRITKLTFCRRTLNTFRKISRYVSIRIVPKHNSSTYCTDRRRTMYPTRQGCHFHPTSSHHSPPSRFTAVSDLSDYWFQKSGNSRQLGRLQLLLLLTTGFFPPL